jgi:hypothetical protein
MASCSSQLDCFRGRLSVEASATTGFISSRAPRRHGSLRTLWNGSLRMAAHANRLLEQERRVLREKQYQWCQSRGQAADRCGATEMLRSEPDRLHPPPPGIVRIFWRGDRLMCCSTRSARPKSASRCRAPQPRAVRASEFGVCSDCWAMVSSWSIDCHCRRALPRLHDFHGWRSPALNPSSTGCVTSSWIGRSHRINDGKFQQIVPNGGRCRACQRRAERVFRSQPVF